MGTCVTVAVGMEVVRKVPREVYSDPTKMESVDGMEERMSVVSVKVAIDVDVSGSEPETPSRQVKAKSGSDKYISLQVSWSWQRLCRLAGHGRGLG